ncbi:hypothetical protein AVEN_169137-1 [Araneus ventricosus]|uniref:Uncharacterized protein n=1 Tax=Araneus ventricosus TaxID=182803 RepID=A0A4Y2TBP9_ARAVE|nr:hypothetical protein AVEN_169137-1 [Araneus ventricosus]
MSIEKSTSGSGGFSHRCLRRSPRDLEGPQHLFDAHGSPKPTANLENWVMGGASNQYFACGLILSKSAIADVANPFEVLPERIALTLATPLSDIKPITKRDTSLTVPAIHLLGILLGGYHCLDPEAQLTSHAFTMLKLRHGFSFAAKCQIYTRIIFNIPYNNSTWVLTIPGISRIQRL